MARRRGNGEGSIYRDARGLYRAALSLDNGKRKVFSGKTRDAVARKLTSALEAHEKRLPLPGVRLKTAKYLTDWLEETVKPSHKPLTYETYKAVVDIHILPAIGKLPLSRIGPEHVQKIQGQMLDKGLSVARINTMRTALSAALSQAERWSLVARNAVRLVDAPRSTPTEPRVLRPDEATAFLHAARGDAMAHLFATMLATGLRPGEARGLRWSDVTLEGSAPALQVRQQVVELKDTTPSSKKRRPKVRAFGEPKSAHGRRTVPLIPLAITALHAQRRHVAALRLHAGPAWQAHDLVFPNELGQPMVSRTARDHFMRIAKQAGIEGATPHTLRHSTGTFLLAAGVPDRVVQAILGHGSAAMTRHYQHVLPSMLADAGTRLAQFMAAAT